MVVDSLKALDPNRPIREADICGPGLDFAFVPEPDIAGPLGPVIALPVGLFYDPRQGEFDWPVSNAG